MDSDIKCIQKISITTQQTFDEIITILLKKTVAPYSSPVKNKIIFNAKQQKYNKYTPTNFSNSVSNYTYKLNNRCLGWSGDTVANLYAEPKVSKNKSVLTTSYDNFISILSGSIQSNSIHNVELKYKNVFSGIEGISTDEIKSLPELEKLFAELFTYDSANFIDMIKLINSIQKKDIDMLIRFISSVSENGEWDSINEKEIYQNTFGVKFLNMFFTNTLIMKLIEINMEQLILTSSYVFTLFKVLFIVFGFSKMTPTVAIENSSFEFPQNNKIIVVSVKLFGELFPHLVSIIGGTDGYFSYVPNMQIKESFEGLTTISEFIWHFYYYSYGTYIIYLSTIKKTTSLNAKINNKIKYLNAI
jgi:hypothetical protein